MLTGSAGFDSFVFNTALNASSNVDRIADFNVAQDTIRLDNAVMPGLGSHVGTLSAASFCKSTSGLAHDANDRIYETDTGWLRYDSNGRAAGGAVRIAQLNPNLALGYSDLPGDLITSRSSTPVTEFRSPTDGGAPPRPPPD